ncbi:MAG TPA: hypothetical protein VGZ22_10270 [Isosphaeraceae bacterium]|jgi:hypothetical protein|nr:hypothetical protein [Isosphaeraceae bacterium]
MPDEPTDPMSAIDVPDLPEQFAITTDLFRALWTIVKAEYGLLQALTNQVHALGSMVLEGREREQQHMEILKGHHTMLEAVARILGELKGDDKPPFEIPPFSLN